MSGRLMSITLFATAALIMAACQQQSKAPAQQQAAQTTSQAPAPAADAVAKAKQVVTEEAAKAKQVVAEQAAKAKQVVTEQAAKAKQAATEEAAKAKQVVTEQAAKAQAAVTEQMAKLQAAAPAPAPKPAAASTETFATTKCQACHAIDHVKVGPAFRDVVAKYGTEDALAKVFESGFAVKDRKIANSDPKFKAKAGLMTSQYRSLIKGHGKAAAHALFMTVKDGTFGIY